MAFQEVDAAFVGKVFDSDTAHRALSIIDVRDIVGLSSHLVTPDGDQSETVRHDPTPVGVNTVLQSVDKTCESYDLIKDAMLEGRWTGPEHPIWKREEKDRFDQG